MGKGDIKTKRGKIRAGSFGKVRPRKKATTTTPAAKSEIKKAAPKKAAKKAAK
jgi:30S ribosomal protein S31